MNVSGSRATDDINLDEYERRLRAAGGQQASAEDPLVELARLVESARFGFSDRAASAEPVAEPAKAREESSRPIEIEELRPTIDEAEDFIPAASEADREARQDYEFPTHPPHDANTAEQAAEGRPKGWKLKVSALALAGVAMIGAVMALKGGVPGLPKQAAVYRGGARADQGAAAQRRYGYVPPVTRARLSSRTTQSRHWSKSSVPRSSLSI